MVLAFAKEIAALVSGTRPRHVDTYERQRHRTLGWIFTRSCVQVSWRHTAGTLDALHVSQEFGYGMYASRQPGGNACAHDQTRPTTVILGRTHRTPQLTLHSIFGPFSHPPTGWNGYLCDVCVCQTCTVCLVLCAPFHLLREVGIVLHVWAGTFAGTPLAACMRA